MSGRFVRALPLVATLALLAGCGAGGFGNKNPADLNSSVSNYVALGDGFAAGPYLGKTTDANCLRSADNYPVQVAKALGVNKVTDVSCTGATTRSLTDKYKATATRKTLRPQLDAVTRDTDLITLGIGIEDRSLLTDMFRICLALPCGTDVSPKPIITQLDLYGQNLTAAVRILQDKAPQAYIVLVGYPSIVPNGNSCSKLPPITTAQLDAANLTLDKVNSTIRSAAQQTGATYVDIAGLSANHSVCSDEPWVSGSTTKKGKSRAYHPLAAEQKAVAAAIAAQVKSR
jgi:hypothetical protein